MNENVKEYAFWGTLALLILFLFYVLSSGGLSGDSGRADRIGEYFDRAIEHQQGAIERIEHLEAESTGIQRKIGEAASQIGSVEKRIDEHQSRLGESDKLIERGQEIVQRIRKRGTIETEKTDFTKK